ncbi:hypothetical protein D9M69_715840 [compost metagenome]
MALRLIAALKAPRGTESEVVACQAGMLTALPVPRRKVSNSRPHGARLSLISNR